MELELSYRCLGEKDVIKKINLLLSDYLTTIYMYNSVIKARNYYLKPVHIVTKKKASGEKIKYYYYGRYWYRIERSSNGRIKWIYIGKEKPISSLPDPPKNPLEGLVVKIDGDELEIIATTKELFEKIHSVLSS